MEIYLRDSGVYTQFYEPFPRGEIVVIGDAVFKNYYKQEELEESKQIRDQLKVQNNNGIFCTGDIGCFNYISDELEIINRTNSQIIKLSQGEFIQLSNVELAVTEHPQVDQCYCYAQTFFKSLIANVQYVTKDCGSITKEKYIQISNKLNAQLSTYCRQVKMLRDIEIPMFFVVDCNEWTCNNQLLTAAMKVKRSSCQEKFKKLNDQIYNKLDSGEAATGSKVLELAVSLQVQLF